jgi:hypothetical protein
MKISLPSRLVPAALALWLAALPANGVAATGRFTITSATFSPGGEALTGGRFRLHAAIGQYDAGALRAGRFALDGGFIPGISLQQLPGAPRLKVRLSETGKAVISWPLDAQGWILEETSTLTSAQWQVVLTPAGATDSEHTVTVPVTGAMKCYRLRQP